MNIAVRYYSRSGNTKAVADAIAAAAQVQAVSVDQDDAAITEPVDVLFIGGALYAYGLDSSLKIICRAWTEHASKEPLCFPRLGFPDMQSI